LPSSLVPQISYLHALILGLIQGATEFLPVSSTGHMRIIPALLHWQDPGSAFSAVVQLGPIVAIIAYFRKDLARYVAAMMGQSKQGMHTNDADARLGWYTLIGTIPLAIAGPLLEKKVDTTFRSLTFVAAGLILFSIFLFIAERVGRRNRGLGSVALGDAVLVGLAQICALVPGASRSGSTITAGLLLNLDRESAARFSFLLSIPAIILAGLYKLYKVLKVTHLGIAIGPYLFATVVAGIIAYVVIAMFIGYLSEDRHSTMPFIIYRIVLGILILVLLHVGYLTPTTGLPADVGAPATISTAR
jgi:undecaprenyl-diphosphatase